MSQAQHGFRPAGGRPGSWREVLAFLETELAINREWQAAVTVRLFRTGQWLWSARADSLLHRLAWKVWVLAERGWFHIVLNADIPPGVNCGVGVRFAHGGRGVVLHPGVQLGQDCVIYHSVTLGLRGSEPRVPVLGNRVLLGAGCVVLGHVLVGDGAAIGPNAVVISNVPPGVHAVAPPPVLRPLRTRKVESDVAAPTSSEGDMGATTT